MLLQGGPGLNLEGNTSAKLTLRLPGSKRVLTRLSLTDHRGYRDPADVGVQHLEARIPFGSESEDCSGDVMLRVGANYSFRHVLEGRHTIAESDDEVMEYHGWAPTSNVGLDDCEGKVEPTDGPYVHIKIMDAKALQECSLVYPAKNDGKQINLVRGAETRPLVFGTRDEFHQFSRWARAQDILVGTELGSGDSRWKVSIEGAPDDSARGPAGKLTSDADFMKTGDGQESFNATIQAPSD